MAAVLLIMAVLAAPIIRASFTQQAELETLERAHAQSQAKIDELNKELNRWDDPDYVRTQARERLKFIQPGTTGFVVLDEKADPPAPLSPVEKAAADVAGSQGPWFGRLWDSVRRADTLDPERPGSQVPAPALTQTPDPAQSPPPTPGAPNGKN